MVETENVINIDDETPKPNTEGTNEVGVPDDTPKPEKDDGNDTPNTIGNQDGRGGGNTKEEAKMGFWDKLFSHPLILAGKCLCSINLY